MASTYASEPLLKLLYSIETDGNLIAPLKVEVQALRLQLSCLRAILSQSGKWHVEDANLKALLTRVQLACIHEYMDLARLYSDFVRLGDPRFPVIMDGLLSGMLERVERLRPDVQEMYSILSKSSRSLADMTNGSVMRHLDSCLENLVDLLGCKADSIVSVKEELEAVQKGLRFLRNFLGFVASRCSKLGKLKDLLIHAEIVADNIACLLYFCCVNNTMDDLMIGWMKLELLSQIQRIKPAQPEVRNIYIDILKASNSATCMTMAAEFFLGFIDSLRENLLELLENNLGYSISVKEQMLTLHEDLSFLECLVLHSPCQEHTDRDQLRFKDFCEHNNVLINEAAFLIYSFYDDVNEGMAPEWNSLASDLLEKIKIAKEEARQIYEVLVPVSLQSNFPRTNAEGYVGSLLWNLKELLSSKTDFVAPLKRHIEAVLEKLQSLKKDFCEIKRHHSVQEELQDHWTHFTDVAYQIECVIDSFLAKDGEIWFHKLGLFDVNEEIKTIQTGLNHIRRKMADESTVLPEISNFPSQIPLQTSPKDELVVFDHESEKIREKLTYGDEKLLILSIVGMPGIGKSALANSVFQHSSVTYHFNVRARCYVGQAYDHTRLLVEILKEVTGQTIDCSDEDLDHMLCQSLRGRRYLIFLDDIWDFELLESMRFSFPDDGNGSRIMITSRLGNIASQAAAECVTYHLSPLSDDKSWEMLQFKLFGKESCPQELVEVGQDIAISCGGLPLTIDLMAGILRDIERRQDCWLQLAQILLQEFAKDPQRRCWEVLEISYNHLPYHLRPCFLYFGGFPKHMHIPARRLQLIWIAEGFVQQPENDERSLEDVATTYLDQLISRSLIMVSVRGSLGRVKLSHVHDLLHEFAIGRAIKERFLLPIDDFSNFSTMSTNGYPWFEEYRLCIYPDYREQFFFSNPSGPRVRSLVFPYYPHNVLPTDKRVFDCPINLSNFRILRVFDLPDIHVKNISPSLLQLIHIRFLALKSCEPEVFSAILQRLQNLETLIIMWGIRGGGILCLKDIDNMARLRFLRHFDISCFGFPRISKVVFEKKMPLQFHNLQYVSAPLLHSGDDHHEKFMRLMPNLQKLKCFSTSSRNLNLSWKLDFLKNLESLTIYGLPDSEYPATSAFCLPPYLKKLTLKSLYLPWTNISALGRLEHLEVLKFQIMKSSTDIWDMVDFGEQFPKLKFLQLAFLDIREWNASTEDLPFLKRLHVLCCEGLEMLPSCLADILTLQEIVLLRCQNSLALSAEEIKNGQIEQGNEQLVVQIRGVIDEDPSTLSKIYYEEGLSVLNGEGEDLSYEQISMIGMVSEMRRDGERA